MNQNSKPFLLCAVGVLCGNTFPGELLPADPGLEGGKGGHWGTKNDSNWIDARWNNMDVGQFMCYTLPVPGGHIHKGISIKLGDREAGACFDAGNLNFRAVWTGGFIKFDGARYGLIKWPKADGPLVYSLADTPGWGAAKGHYRGLYRNGERVVLSYTVGDSAVLESPWIEKSGGILAITRTLQVGPEAQAQSLLLAELPGAAGSLKEIDGTKLAVLEKGGDVVAAGIAGDSGASPQAGETRVSMAISEHPGVLHIKALLWAGKVADLPRFAALVKSCSKPEDLEELRKPGPPRWGAPLPTTGTISADQKPYVIDTITVPYKNPFNALMFLSGADFFANGDAAVCSLHGDVWIVRGIDEKLDKITWQRFATGLFQPLGLKIVNDKVCVLGRDQITLLHDSNGDGEADFYENFNNASNTSSDGHYYSACLETDSAGNFYHVDPFGLHRISKDGAAYETLATGWRNPISLSIGPGDVITVSPQEGEWTPASNICEVKIGGYYGYPGPHMARERPMGYDAPLCYLPRLLDNSTGGQVWVTSERWGPLKGQLLNLSFGQCSMQIVLRENIAGQPQGGVVPLPLRFLSGAVRGRFRQNDGQLYVVGTFGWVTSAVRDGSFQRVRYTGAKACLPVGLNVHANGIRIAFSEPLQREAAEDAENFSIEQWNYHYGAQYGSSEYSVLRPNAVGHDALSVKSVHMAQDGRSVFLEIPGLQPVMQMRIKYILKTSEGEGVRGEIDNTINGVGN